MEWDYNKTAGCPMQKIYYKEQEDMTGPGLSV